MTASRYVSGEVSRQQTADQFLSGAGAVEAAAYRPVGTDDRLSRRRRGAGGRSHDVKHSFPGHGEVGTDGIPKV